MIGIIYETSEIDKDNEFLILVQNELIKKIVLTKAKVTTTEARDISLKEIEFAFLNGDPYIDFDKIKGANIIIAFKLVHGETNISIVCSIIDVASSNIIGVEEIVFNNVNDTKILVRAIMPDEISLYYSFETDFLTPAIDIKGNIGGYISGFSMNVGAIYQSRMNWSYKLFGEYTALGIPLTTMSSDYRYDFNSSFGFGFGVGYSIPITLKI